MSRIVSPVCSAAVRARARVVRDRRRRRVQLLDRRRRLARSQPTARSSPTPPHQPRPHLTCRPANSDAVARIRSSCFVWRSIWLIWPSTRATRRRRSRLAYSATMIATSAPGRRPRGRSSAPELASERAELLPSRLVFLLAGERVEASVTCARAPPRRASRPRRSRGSRPRGATCFSNSASRRRCASFDRGHLSEAPRRRRRRIASARPAPRAAPRRLASSASQIGGILVARRRRRRSPPCVASSVRACSAATATWV